MTDAMTDSAFQHMDVSTLAHWLEGDGALTLLDIRDPVSYSNGHIPGIRHLDNDSVAALVAESPVDQPLVVVCYHGHSSQQAAAWLAGQGFAEVYSLDGGFTDWAYRHPERVES